MARTPVKPPASGLLQLWLTSLVRDAVPPKDVFVPRKFPPEFKRDVVTVARRGDLPVNEVAADFGVAPETVRRWMRQADVDDGVNDGRPDLERAVRDRAAAPDQPQARDGERDPAPGGLLRQGRSPEMTYPLVQELAAAGIPVRLTCGVLGFSL
jgi:transposase-like protein